MTLLEREIRDDRQLLDALGMSDPEAAMYLGKSRQAFNNQLGPRRGGDFPVPTNYFKISDILVLVIAAQEAGHDFDRSAVRRYVERTRRPEPAAPNAPFDLLEAMLTGSQKIDFSDAAVIVLILPAFADMRSSVPDLAGELKETLHLIRAVDPAPEVVILSSTRMRAQMAANWLQLPNVHTAWHDFVDHYVPTVLIYDRGQAVPRPFVLTHQGGLVPAPQFRAAAMSECVHFMAPDAWDEAFRAAEAQAAAVDV